MPPWQASLGAFACRATVAHRLGRCYHRHFGRGRALTSSSARGATASRAPAFTDRQFRDALAQFATGVSVICAPGPHGRFVGLTANSFNSVSLDPPLVVWSLNRRVDEPRRVREGRALRDQRARARPDRARAPVFATARRSVRGRRIPAGRGGRAADRRLRRVVRVPAPRAAPRGRSRAVHRRSDDLRPEERTPASCSITAASATHPPVGCRRRSRKSAAPAALSMKPAGSRRLAAGAS